MDATENEAATATGTSTVKVGNLLKIAFASLVGTTVDFYDFIVSGLAATLAWGIVFFPSSNPLNRLLLALAVYAVGLAARPIGNLFFAHFGDKMGRRFTLVWTLATAGAGTLGIALVPTYAQIGISAAVLLTIFRFVQSFGLGGEWGGATSWMIEFANSGKSKHRGFWTAWVQLSIPLATAISAGLFTFLISNLGFPNFIAYGWRIPFYFGTGIIVVGILIRLLTEESPMFVKTNKRKDTVKAPSLSIWKGNTKNLVKLILLFAFAAEVYFIITVFSPGYLEATGISAHNAAISVLAAGIMGLIVTISGGFVGDKVGRKKVIYFSLIGSIIFTVPYFLLLNTGNYSYIILAQVAYVGILQFQLASTASLGSEYFPTKFRYSGVGFQLTLGSVIGGGVATVIAPLILHKLNGPQNAWPYIAAVIIAVCVVALASLITLRETYKEELAN